MWKYFDIKSDEWKITVKWCVKIGFILGLINGARLYLNY